MIESKPGCHVDLKASTGGETSSCLGQLYDQLCNHAWRGELKGAGVGSNCRTWSILRWFPKPGAPVPVTGRKDPECWGLPSLQPHEQEDTDNDGLHLLRLMILAHIIHMRYEGPGLPWCFLEHPEALFQVPRRKQMFNHMEDPSGVTPETKDRPSTSRIQALYTGSHSVGTLGLEGSSTL